MRRSISTHNAATRRRSRPKPAIRGSRQRCAAASPERPFVHIAAFSEGEGRHCGQTGLVQTRLLLTQKAIAHARGKFGGAAGFAKPAVQALRTRGILNRPIAAIVLSPQPVQECLRTLRDRLIRENDKVTRVFNSDIGQSDKRSVANFWRDQIIPKGQSLTVDYCLDAAV